MEKAYVFQMNQTILRMPMQLLVLKREPKPTSSHSLGKSPGKRVTVPPQNKQQRRNLREKKKVEDRCRICNIEYESEADLNRPKNLLWVECAKKKKKKPYKQNHSEFRAYLFEKKNYRIVSNKRPPNLFSNKTR